MDYGLFRQIPGSRTLALVLLIFLFSFPIAAQATKPRQATPAAKPAALLTPFDPSVETMPKNYHGTDATALFAVLRQHRIDGQKSQFETEAEFEARISSLTGFPLNPQSKIGDAFAFVIGAASGWSTNTAHIDTSYDAESKELTVTIPISDVWREQVGNNGLAFLWRSSTTNTGSYVGSNAFGVKASIRRSVVKDLYIVAQDADWIAGDCQKTFHGIACKLSVPDRSIAAVYSLVSSALLIGHLVPPFISVGSDRIEPTLESRVDAQIEEKFVHIALDQVWIYEAGLGAVPLKLVRNQNEPVVTEHPVSIPRAVALGMLLQKEEPVYPPIAKAARVTGPVVLKTVISLDGNVSSAQVVSGPAMLQQSALDAVRKWRFQPYLLNNKPVSVETEIVVGFKD